MRFKHCWFCNKLCLVWEGENIFQTTEGTIGQRAGTEASVQLFTQCSVMTLTSVWIIIMSSLLPYKWFLIVPKVPVIFCSQEWLGVLLQHKFVGLFTNFFINCQVEMPGLIARNSKSTPLLNQLHDLRSVKSLKSFYCCICMVAFQSFKAALQWSALQSPMEQDKGDCGKGENFLRWGRTFEKIQIMLWELTFWYI